MYESYWDSLGKQNGSHISQLSTLPVYQQRASENVSLCLLNPFWIVEKMQACHQSPSSHVDMDLFRDPSSSITLHNTPFHVPIY